MKQSLTQLRGLAQSMGVKWAFSDDHASLQQKIRLRQTDMLPPSPIIPVHIPEDQRMRVRPPSKVSDEKILNEVMAPFVARGLKLTIKDDQFHMQYGEKIDTGNTRQPPRVLVQCAQRLMA